MEIICKNRQVPGVTNLLFLSPFLTNVFSSLQHADRCTVLTEVIEYIGALETQLEELRRKKSLVLGSLSEFEQHNTTWNEIQAGTPVTGKKHENTRLLSAGKKPETFAAAAVTVYARDSVIMVSSPRKKGLWSELILLLHQQDVEIVNVTLASTADSYFHWIHAKVVDSYVGYY